MGCSNTREGTIFSSLSLECDELMQKNLEILTIIEYILIGKNKKSAALSILLIKKKTKEYYEILASYRQFWISKAKKSIQNSTSTLEWNLCENEQNKEKRELLKCNEILDKHLNALSLGWKKEYKTSTAYKTYLEQAPQIIQISTTFRQNYYTANKETIKNGIKELNIPLDDADMNLLKSIKSVTTQIYKVAEKRVYHTEEIIVKQKFKEHAKEKEKERDSLKEIHIPNKVKLVDRSRDEPTRDRISKSSRPDSGKKISRNEAALNDDENSFFESEDEDSDDFPRLSISQK